MPSPLHHLWSLDANVTFLNHGSFGACPIEILKTQQALRARLERDPVRFMQREEFALREASRETLAGMLHADPADVVFVANVTTGLNAVMRSLRFEPGDELLITDHAYGSCRNAMEYIARREGATLVEAPVPFPVESPDQIVDAIVDAVTPRTRFAMIDHVTAPTAMIFPVHEIVVALEERGVDTFVDGAHTPGMIALDLPEIAAAYYTGNCHKWLCAPKGAGFLHVRKDRQDGIHPTTISHGYAAANREDLTPLQQAFRWSGTIDPTAWLCVGPTIDYLGSIHPGGLEELRRRNHELIVEARELLCASWGTRPPCPSEMLGSMAIAPLPSHDFSALPAPGPEWNNPLQGFLYERHRIEVPVMNWRNGACPGVRISAQAYNAIEDYEKLARAVMGATGSEIRRTGLAK